MCITFCLTAANWTTDVEVCFCLLLKAIDEPPYLTVGTDVSAKYRGAFCEAKIKTAKRLVKVKVCNLLITRNVGFKFLAFVMFPVFVLVPRLNVVPEIGSIWIKVVTLKGFCKLGKEAAILEIIQT